MVGWLDFLICLICCLQMTRLVSSIGSCVGTDLGAGIGSQGSNAALPGAVWGRPHGYVTQQRSTSNPTIVEDADDRGRSEAGARNSATTVSDTCGRLGNNTRYNKMQYNNTIQCNNTIQTYSLTASDNGSIQQGCYNRTSTIDTSRI